jgi:hypothetical protein
MDSTITKIGQIRHFVGKMLHIIIQETFQFKVFNKWRVEHRVSSLEGASKSNFSQTMMSKNCLVPEMFSEYEELNNHIQCI